jgi:hypothetical protein
MARPGFGVFGCLLGVAGLVSACKTTTSSADLATSGIDVEIQVSAASVTASKVSVSLHPAGYGGDPLDVVNLEGGDALYAETSGLRMLMAAENLDYESSFAVGASETPFRMRLARARADFIDAPDSTDMLPAAFDLGPLDGDVSERRT